MNCNKKLLINSKIKGKEIIVSNQSKKDQKGRGLDAVVAAAERLGPVDKWPTCIVKK